jgi:hypothetical protein
MNVLGLNLFLVQRHTKGDEFLASSNPGENIKFPGCKPESRNIDGS